jgi:hypothetical protein
MAKAGRKLAPPLTAADLAAAYERPARRQAQPPAESERAPTPATATPAVLPVLPAHLRSKLTSDFELDWSLPPDEEEVGESGATVAVVEAEAAAEVQAAAEAVEAAPHTPTPTRLLAVVEPPLDIASIVAEEVEADPEFVTGELEAAVALHAELPAAEAGGAKSEENAAVSAAIDAETEALLEVLGELEPLAGEEVSSAVSGSALEAGGAESLDVGDEDDDGDGDEAEGLEGDDGLVDDDGLVGEADHDDLDSAAYAAIGRGRRRHPVLLRLLVVLAVLGLVGVWAAWRSSPKLEREVSARLEGLGERLGGTFRYEAMGPAGLTGIEITGLRFEPAPGADDAAGEATHAFEIDAVRVFPDLWSLVGRQIRLGDAEVIGMRFRAGPDLEAVLDRSGVSAGTGAGEGAASALESGCGRLAELPRRVRLEGSTVSLGSLRGRPLPELALRHVEVELGCEEQRIRATVAGRITVGTFAPERASADLRATLGGGGGHQLDVDFDDPFAFATYLPTGLLPDGAELTLAGLHVTPRSVRLTGLEGAGLDQAVPRLDDWRVDGLSAEALEVHVAAGGPTLALSDAIVELASGERVHGVGIRRLDLWVDHGLEEPGGTLLLGRPDDEGRSGTLRVSLSESEYGAGRVLSLQADDYPLEELAALAPADAPVRVEAGRLDGSIALSVVDGEPVWAVIDAHLRRGVVDVPQLAARPLRAIDAGFEGELVVAGDRTEVVWERSELRLGEVRFATDGRIARDDGGPHVELFFDADEVDAAALHNALPRGLVPASEGVRVAGVIDGSLRLDLDVARPDDAVVDLDLDMSRARVAAMGTDLPIDLLAGDFSLAIETADGHERVIGPTTPGWVSLADAGPYVVAALTSAEDGRYWTHNGFDWRAIQSSIRENLRQQRFARGGSTISQQVARSLFLVRERTLGRKLEEAFITWQLEERLSKERIMELYINIVHWGPAIYGVREAAAAYFGREPRELSVREAVFLASILSNPNVYGVQYARDELAESRTEKMCNVLTNMAHIEAITRREATESCEAIRAGRISDAPRPVDLLPRDELARAPAARL